MPWQLTMLPLKKKHNESQTTMQLRLPCRRLKIFLAEQNKRETIAATAKISCSVVDRFSQCLNHSQFKHEVYSSVLMKQNKKRFQGGKPHTSVATHDVFIHCFHHFLQATIRTHWLILLASYWQAQNKQHHEASVHPMSNAHSIIDTK